MTVLNFSGDPQSSAAATAPLYPSCPTRNAWSSPYLQWRRHHELRGQMISNVDMWTADPCLPRMCLQTSGTDAWCEASASKVSVVSGLPHIQVMGPDVGLLGVTACKAAMLHIWGCNLLRDPTAGG